MRIESVEPFLFHHWLVVQIDTDTGITGYGPSAYWGYPDAAERIVSAFRQQLVGTDPLRVEQHWNRLFYWKPFRDGAITGAVAAVDIALWDIAGRHFGVPAYQLLGGKQRETARLHLLIDSPGHRHAGRGSHRRRRRRFHGRKVRRPARRCGRGHGDLHLGHADDRRAHVTAARDAVGWEIDLILELHRDFNPGEVIALAGELERFRLYFIEDPIPPHSADAHADVLRHSRIPVAVGERQTTIYEFREMLARGARFLRPDVGMSGGLTHCKKIATLAEAHHAQVITHNFFNPLVTAATLQLYAAIPNAGTLEYLLWEEEPPRSEMLKSPLRRDGGYLPIPDGPGLGVDFDPAIVDRYPYQPWEYPPQVRMRGDGSVFLK